MFPKCIMACVREKCPDEKRAYMGFKANWDSEMLPGYRVSPGWGDWKGIDWRMVFYLDCVVGGEVRKRWIHEALLLFHHPFTKRTPSRISLHIILAFALGLPRHYVKPQSHLHGSLDVTRHRHILVFSSFCHLITIVERKTQSTLCVRLHQHAK